MPAQASKYKNGRYTRQTEISRSRSINNINRSASSHTGDVRRGYSDRSYRSVYDTPMRVSREGLSGLGTGSDISRAYSRQAYTDTVLPRQRYTAPDTPTRSRRPNSAISAKRPAVSAMTQREEAIKIAKSRLFYCCVVAIMFILGAILIYRQTAIFSRNQEIDKLNTEYNNILVTNEEIQSNINKSVELGNLESVAKNELGMISPDSSQVFYIDMGNRDEVVDLGKN